MMIAVAWIIFVGHQAKIMEQKTWRLEQDKKFQNDIEQLKTNFVSLISHDLKTPIAKIQAIADRLLLQNLADPIQKDLKNLRASSDELHHYIQSILKLLRVESRDLKLNREACDLNEIITQAVTQLQPLATEKNIEVRTNLEPLFSIEADATLIKEVLVNLIDNAIKYTPIKGEIIVSTREIEDRVLVTISDNGVGIPLEEQEFVWQKFARGKDQALKSKGSGLGLYLVKFFIELHGGQVNLDSNPAKGTKVSFSLPLEAEE
jgi:signal transduction histidine kinase